MLTSTSVAALLTAVSAGADRSCIFADTRFTPEPVHVVHLHRLGVGCTVATVTALHHGQVVELVKKKCAAAAILGLRRGREGNKRFCLSVGSGQIVSLVVVKRAVSRPAPIAALSHHAHGDKPRCTWPLI